MITEVPILPHYKQGVKKFIKIDLSNYVCSKVFFQIGNDRLHNYFTFFTQNLNLIKCNYKIYDKELLALI